MARGSSRWLSAIPWLARMLACVVAELPAEGTSPTGLALRNATFKLYPGSYKSPKGGSCSAKLPAETMVLPPDVCLSGDYYLSNNVELQRPPVCDDGNMAYMAVFGERGCTGNRTWFDHGRASLPACLDKKTWPLGSPQDRESRWSHWSLMFYCADLATALASDGAHEHRAAKPPSIAAHSDVPRDGRFQIFDSRANCESRTHVVKDENLGAASYLNLPAYLDDPSKGWVRVAEPAFCADGSRAQFAMYKDVDCASHHHSGTHDHDAVLLDVTDEGGFRCHDVGEYVAVAFSCTGVGKLPAAKHLVVFETRSTWVLVVIILSAALLVGAGAFVCVKGVGGTLRLLVSSAAALEGDAQLTRSQARGLRRFGIAVEVKKVDKTS